MLPLKEKYNNEDELINEFCTRNKCNSCKEFEPESLEPKSFPCDEMEDWLNSYYVLIDTDE